MNEGYVEYIGMLRRFISHEMTADEFQTAFFARFQDETPDMDESLFSLLDELFGALECYTDDSQLLAESPEYYLDFRALELEASGILRRLEVWDSRRAA